MLLAYTLDLKAGDARRPQERAPLGARNDERRRPLIAEPCGFDSRRLHFRERQHDSDDDHACAPLWSAACSLAARSYGSARRQDFRRAATRRESMRRSLVAFLVLLPVALSGCSNADTEVTKPASTRTKASAPRLGTARLRDLELTYHVPAQVRQACAEARRLASVHVLCPRLIPDVPLTRIAGLWGSIVVDAEPRFYMRTFNNGGLPGGSGTGSPAAAPPASSRSGS